MGLKPPPNDRNAFGRGPVRVEEEMEMEVEMEVEVGVG